MKNNEILAVLIDLHQGFNITVQYAPLSEADNHLLTLCVNNFQYMIDDLKRKESNEEITITEDMVVFDDELLINTLKDIQTGLTLRKNAPMVDADSLSDLLDGTLQNLNVVLTEMI